MDTAMVGTRSNGRRPLAALGKLSVAALAGMAGLLVYAIVQFGFYPPVLIFIAAALILAGIVAMGWRWAPLLGVIDGNLCAVDSQTGQERGTISPRHSRFAATAYSGIGF